MKSNRISLSIHHEKINYAMARPFKPSGAQVFLGANQVVHQTSQVVYTTLKRPSENTAVESEN